MEDFLNGSNPTYKVREQSIFKRREEEHLRFFVNQIFYIVQVAQQGRLSVDPWKHICIGSDFDGLIRSIDTCKNVANLGQLGETLTRHLPDLACEANIPLPRSAASIAEDIFFNNAFHILSSI